MQECFKSVLDSLESLKCDICGEPIRIPDRIPEDAGDIFLGGLVLSKESDKGIYLVCGRCYVSGIFKIRGIIEEVVE